MRSHVFSRRPDPTRPDRPRAHRWSSLCALLLACLLALSFLPQAQAASLGKKPPHKLTAAQIQAIQQQLKKQIQVKHTGHALKPAGVASGSAPVQPIRPQVTGLPAYNNIGITDPATRSIGNFSGTRSLSAQALQDVGLVPGITVTSQNITYIWPAVPTGQADNYKAAGQIIPVIATAGAATVGFLGISTGGSTSGTATLTYTDGTTTTFTLGLTDWTTSTPAFGDQQVVHMTTVNTKYGTKSGNYYLYSITTSLNTSKTLQSVTLPSTVSPGTLHVFAVGVGGPAFNNTGISDDSNTTAGNFDGGTNSYSAEALASSDLVPGKQFDADGIAYSWPTAASGSPDNYQVSGQVLPIIPVPNATTLGLLGAAAGGSASGTATMTFTDGTTQTFTLSFGDWAQAAIAGNTAVATMSYRNTSGGKQSITIYLFTTEVAIPAGKTLQSVTLPATITGKQMHIFAIGTRGAMNDLGTSNDSQPGEGAFFGHNSYSIQALEAAGITPGQPFNYDGASFTLPASYGTLADNYQVNGQTQVLPVTPVPNATTLIVLGASVLGNESGTATITYTDNSTQTFTLSLSDWLLNSNGESAAFGNGVVATMAYENTPTGQGTKYKGYLFSTEVALQPAKTVQSLTLPTTLSPTTGQMNIFAVSTRSIYNNTGISDDSNPSGANYDGSNDSYSEEDFQNPNVAGWNPGDTLTYEGINYIWPGVPAAQADNYQAAGQVIPISAPAGATTLGFVGAATGAGSSGASGTVTLTYTDGSTSTFTLTLSDWMLGGNNSTFGPASSNHLFALLPHENTLQGQQTVNTYLFEVETPLNASKQLQSVTLPASVANGQIHVFMMATRTGENYPNNVGTSDDSDTQFASLDGHGASYSIEALEAAGVYEGQPFTFNGVTFNWPASYSVIPDNYQAAGQTIPATQVSGPLSNAATLAFLGAATNAGSSEYGTGTATIHYTDGTSTTFTLAMTDWWSPTAQSGDQIAARCSYINNATGQQTQAVNLYYTSVSVTAGKTIQSVTLPSTVSSGQMHIFAVGTKVGTDTPGLVGSWKFDEGSGTTTADASGSGYTGTLTGGPTWTTGITSDALSFAGNGSTVDINQSVLNTSNSYSVAAWVQLSSLSNYHTAVSQDGTNVSGFYLQYTGSVFAFSTVSTDATSGTTTRATASATPALNTWYYLVGVYDASSNQIKLYVNGALVSTKSVPAAWNATGEAVIGRSKWNGTTADSWTGLIDDVQMYDRALSDQEVATLYNAG